MATILPEIYDALADVPVVYDGAVVGVYKPADMRNRINRDALPLRVLSPIGQERAPATVNTLVFDPRGTGTVIWTVFDLFLIAPLTAGDGVREFGQALLDATKAYIDVMTQHINLIPRGARIGQIQADPAVYTYNKTDYFGVEFRLEIREILNG